MNIHLNGLQQRCIAFFAVILGAALERVTAGASPAGDGSVRKIACRASACKALSMHPSPVGASLAGDGAVVWPALASLAGALLCFWTALPVQAEPDSARAGEWAARPDTAQLHGGLRAASFHLGYQTLGNGQPDWRESGLRGQYELQAHQLAGELLSARRYGEDGVFVGLQDTLQLGEVVWGSLALGAGDGASYLPRWRADGFLYRKFGPTQRWIGSLGLGHYRAPDGYRDQNLTLGLSYWFESPWVLQAEWRHNRSHPGNIDTRQYALAASWGQAGQTQMTLRHGWGREGYQVRGEGNTVVNFASHETSFNLQHSLAPDWGLRAGAVRYRAQGQRRDGVELGIFKAWP